MTASHDLLYLNSNLYKDKTKPGKCANCGEQTKWDGHDGGFYRKFCSRQCANSDKQKIAITDSRNREKYGCGNQRGYLKRVKDKIIEKNKGEYSPITNKGVKLFRKAQYFLRKGNKHYTELDLLKHLRSKHPVLFSKYCSIPTTEYRIRRKVVYGTLKAGPCGTCGNKNITVYIDSYINSRDYGYCSHKCAASNEKTKQTRKETCLDKYGYNFANQVPEFQNKRRKTNLRKRGSETPFGCAEIQDKIKNTLMKKYGVDNISKSYTHQIKKLNSGTRSKPYQLGTRKVLTQGYENTALDYLIKNKNVRPDRLVVSKEGNVPVIEYKWSNKDRKYFPDLFIKDKNMIIEVKSTRTIVIDFYRNCAKARACLKQGFKFVLLVFNKKQDRIFLPKKWYLWSEDKMIEFMYINR